MWCITLPRGRLQRTKSKVSKQSVRIVFVGIADSQATPEVTFSRMKRFSDLSAYEALDVNPTQVLRRGVSEF